MVYFTLKEQLKTKNMTMYRLFKLTGISINAISKICNNKSTQIKLETLSKICNTLDCDVSDIIKYKNNNEI